MTEVFNKNSEKLKRKILRNNMPKAELILWQFLKCKQLNGHKFRRQYSVDGFVIDFYCPILKLAIEVDGDSHYTNEAEEYDIERQRFIESFDIKFLRFSNLDVYTNIDNVIETILLETTKTSPSPSF